MTRNEHRVLIAVQSALEQSPRLVVDTRSIFELKQPLQRIQKAMR